MNERYFGQISQIIDKYTIVANKGESDNIKEGDWFLIVKLGEVILDPESKKELEQLEIVCGKVAVTHIQSSISTMKSCEYEKEPDVRETKKITPSSTNISNHSMYSLLSTTTPQNTTIESTKPGAKYLKELMNPSVGDYLIKITKPQLTTLQNIVKALNV